MIRGHPVFGATEPVIEHEIVFNHFSKALGFNLENFQCFAQPFLQLFITQSTVGIVRKIGSLVIKARQEEVYFVIDRSERSSLLKRRIFTKLLFQSAERGTVRLARV